MRDEAARQKDADKGIRGYLAISGNKCCGRCGQHVPDSRNSQVVCWRCTQILCCTRKAGYKPSKPIGRPCPDCDATMRPGCHRCDTCGAKKRREGVKAATKRRRAARSRPHHTEA